MAREILPKHRQPEIVGCVLVDEVYALSRKEAADLVGLLTAQLAGVTLIGNQGGACPEIKIVDRGVVIRRLVLMLESEESR